MNLLLDTHSLIWLLSDSHKLKPAARSAIQDRFNLVYVSAASTWEVEIKRAMGKLDIPKNFRQTMEKMQLMELSISIEHSESLADLPMHHKDPFDRMLIAQAKQEGLTLVTRDKIMRQYDVPILVA